MMEASQTFLSTLRQLATQIRDTDPALHRLAYFSTPTDSELRELRRSTIDKLAEAKQCARLMLDDVLPVLDGTPLEDLAGMIANELRRDLRHIETSQTEGSTTLQIGIVAVQLLSKVLKAATAIENTYCSEAQVESEVSYVAEVEAAIAIRRAYAKMWRSIDQISQQRGLTLEHRLRSASTTLAFLSGRPIFLDMRTLDRNLLLRLLRRIRDWLVEPSDQQRGERLWGDVVGFASLVRQINHRAELVEHDRMTLQQLSLALEAPDLDFESIAANPQILRLTKPLTGLTPELDTLLANAPTTPIAPLREVVDRMMPSTPSHQRPGAA